MKMMNKPVISRLLLLFCILPSFLILGSISISNASLPDVWDGSASSSFDSGIGSKSDPYIIKTPEQLAFFARSVNDGNSYEGMYIELGSDILLNDESFTFDSDSGLIKISDENSSVYLGTGVKGDGSGENTFFDTVASEGKKYYATDTSSDRGIYSGKINKHIPIGTYGAPFKGTFDGAGYLISGLYAVNSSDYFGLFGHIEDANVKNIRIENSLIFSGANVGAITGAAHNSYISGCYTDTGVLGLGFVGGCVGENYSSVIDSCCNVGNVFADQRAGGICGLNRGSISNCYNTGSVYCGREAGGITGYDESGSTVSRCYNVGNVGFSNTRYPISGTNKGTVVNTYFLSNESSLVGALTSDQMKKASSFTGFDFENVWNIGRAEGYPYPTLSAIKYTEHTHLFDNDCDASCNLCEYTRSTSHKYEDARDDSGHFVKCTVCLEVTSFESHSYQNSCDNACDVCGYIRITSHSYGKEISKDENYHFYKCSVCGEKKDREKHLFDGECDATCNICEYMRTVDHDYSNTYESDKNYHWLKCKVCGENGEKSEHIPGPEATEVLPQTCTLCSELLKPCVAHKHSFDEEPLYDNEYHWKQCVSCGEKESVEAHKWNNGEVTVPPSETEHGLITYKCEVCAKEKTQVTEKLPESDPTFDENENNKDDNGTEKSDDKNTSEAPDKENTTEDNFSEKDKDQSSSEKISYKKSLGLPLVLGISALCISVINLVIFAFILIYVAKLGKKNTQN